MLEEGQGTALGQEGYGTAINSTEATMDKSFITESIFCYAERATASEGKVQELEDHLNKLEIRNHQPPPQTPYYAHESAYYTPQQPAAGIPPTINAPPPAQNQWTRQATFQQQGQHPMKRVRNGPQQGGHQHVQFSHYPNITYHPPAPPYHNKPYGRSGRLRRTPPRKTWRNRKHADDPHQQYSDISQSTLLFYM